MELDFISKVNHFKWTGFQDIDWVFQGLIGFSIGRFSNQELDIKNLNGFLGY